MEFIWKSLKIPLSCVRLRQPNVCHLTNKPSKWLIPSNGIKWNIESVWIFWCPIYSFMNVNKYLISEENKLQVGSLHSFLMVFSCFGINFIVSSCFVIHFTFFSWYLYVLLCTLQFPHVIYIFCSVLYSFFMEFIYFVMYFTVSSWYLHVLLCTLHFHQGIAKLSSAGNCNCNWVSES